MQEIIPFLLPASVALASILVFFSTYMKRKNDVTTAGQTASVEVINTFQTQVAQLKEQRLEDKKNYDETLAKFTIQVNTLSSEVGRLTGIISEKDKQIERYEKIFQNRDPELLKVLQEIKEFMKDMHTKLTIVDDRTKKSEERNLKIDLGHGMAVN